MSKKGIILFGHGARNPEWAAPFHRVRAEMQRQMPNAELGLAFLELMQPDLPTAMAAMVAAGADEIAVVPLFISAGSHIREDLPRLAAEAMQAHPGIRVSVAAPLGDAPEMIAAMAAYAVAQVTEPAAGLSLPQGADRRLQQVIAATNDGIWEYDLSAHRYSYLSPQAICMLGAVQSEAMLVDVTAARAVIHPEDLPQVLAAFKQHLLHGQPYDLEMRIRNDKGWLWVRTRGTVVRDAQGQALSMVGAMIDINDIHLANERLLRHQRLIRTVLDVIPEPVLVKDRNFRLLMVNRAYADRAGESIENLLGRDTREFMPAGEAERLVQADRAVFESGCDQVFEINVPDRSQHMVRSYIVTKRRAYDGDGQPIMVGIHNDVTDLKRSLAQFAAVIQDTPLVAVQGMDRRCVVSHWNRASEALFGIPRGLALGSVLPEMVLEPRMQVLFTEVVERVWSERTAFGPTEVKLRLRDGRLIWLLAVVFPVLQDGVVVEVFSMAVDVTARHKAERALARHSEHLQEMVDQRTENLLRTAEELRLALQAKSAFLANMSHELRTPMHAILGFARLGLERGGQLSPERVHDYYERIVASGERLLRLINDLLDLSRLEIGGLSLQLAPHDLREVAAAAGRELDVLLAEKQLHLQLPDAGRTWLALMDRERMHQVVSNLLSNAIKFSPPGAEIVIRLEEAMLAGAVSAIRLTVEDGGVGIPDGELELIFDKFVQSSKTRTGAGGTGLGLSICREIMHAHKGTITAHNRSQGGAVFEILLPLCGDGPA